MNLHEYQAKQWLGADGVPVPSGQVVNKADDIDPVISSLIKDMGRLVVKAQVHAGGRGKAGGVKLVDSSYAAVEAVNAMLGSQLVTEQTTEEGQPVNQVLLEETCNIDRELYLGAVVDRAKHSIVIMVSNQGGVDIEKVAAEQPDEIISVVIDPLIGVMPFQCRYLGGQLKLTTSQIKVFTALVTKLTHLFVRGDLSLLEINPLVVTTDGQLICLDAKVNIDDNALYRQPAFAAMRDLTQEDERERQAQKWHLSYIALEGNIGCMVNGAGLAMATMDLIKLFGGQPANFLDVGGTADEERVTEAFKIILQDEQVEGVLVNIFGGIVRCDLIADGIINAVSKQGIKIPVVVRLAGNRALEATEKLRKSGLNIIGIADFSEAAQCIVDEVMTSGASS